LRRQNSERWLTVDARYLTPVVAGELGFPSLSWDVGDNEESGLWTTLTSESENKEEEEVRHSLTHEEGVKD
jgi:hypothetical protein